MRRARRLPASLILLLVLALAVPPAVWADATKTTDYYTIHYGQWEQVASSLTPYLNAAFTTASGVLGYSNPGYGKIDIYFYSDPKSNTLGYTYPGENAIHINLYYGDSTNSAYLQDYGATVAHETGHVLFFHETNIQNRYSWDTVGGSEWTWITESLSYYIGDVAYPYGSQYSKAQLSSIYSYYSQNGKLKESWYHTGRNYKLGANSSLTLVQLDTIGKFLVDTGGLSAVQAAVRNLAAGDSFDTAFSKAFGKSTGMNSTASGAGVNTLYSDYLYYYLGHY